MRGLENRIEKLEGVCRPQRRPIPNLVMLYENGEPVNRYYAEVLRPNREVEFRDMKMQPSLERALKHKEILGA